MNNSKTPDEIIRALRTLRCADPCDCLSCPCEQFRSYDTGNACDDGTRLAAADLIESLQTRIAELESQLSESQRREQAAVEDLNGTGACFTCKHFRRNGGDCFGAGRCRLDGIEIWPCNEPGVYRVEVPDDGRQTYEWRGPQEAGKGEQA